MLLALRTGMGRILRSVRRSGCASGARLAFRWSALLYPLPDYGPVPGLPRVSDPHQAGDHRYQAPVQWEPDGHRVGTLLAPNGISAILPPAVELVLSHLICLCLRAVARARRRSPTSSMSGRVRAARARQAESTRINCISFRYSNPADHQIWVRPISDIRKRKQTCTARSVIVNPSPPTLLELDFARKPKGLRAFFFGAPLACSCSRYSECILPRQNRKVSSNQSLRLQFTHLSTKLTTLAVGNF